MSSKYGFNGNAEVIVRIPQPDGGFIELKGHATSIQIDVSKDSVPMYNLGSPEPVFFQQGQSVTRFSIEGIANHQDRIEGEEAPGMKTVKPSRWSDVMEEIDD